ncbi:atypical/RIO/RIO1 protein kinase [Ceratobasidium sp. AG-Ba]|nr:atypical/RIO/RIO1 protein kinase [Ceratobasidium sp. AG-Ba]
MKLDATDLRYITNDEFRVLTSVEMGSKNHEVVPSSLIAQISCLRNGGVNKLLGQLAKRNLIARVQNAKYDGYRLTYGGYDYLALRAFTKRDTIHSVGNQIGVGKESDIYVVADSESNQMVLKLHRLGRVSFRAIKEKRDYMGKRKSASWMYMSRLAAKKEWEFMKVLHEHGFPVPKPIDQARHCILMELIDAFPLRQISSHPNPGSLYSTLMDVIVRFAKAGLIHGDFNEFNILIRRETGIPVVIDFPQMVSTRHANAEWYFNRDVECIRRFFRRRFNYESAVYPRFSKILATDGENGEQGFRLDVIVSASGFGGKDMKLLDEYIASKLQEGGSGSDEPEDEDEGEDSGDGYPEFRQMRPAAQDFSVRHERRHILEQPASDEEQGGHLSGRDLALSINSLRIQENKGEEPGQARDDDDEELPSDHDARHDASDSDGEDREDPAPSKSTVRDLVASTLEKERRRNAKHHSKRGTTKVGRAKGHKGKTNARIRADASGVWD